MQIALLTLQFFVCLSVNVDSQSTTAEAGQRQNFCWAGLGLEEAPKMLSALQLTKISSVRQQFSLPWVHKTGS